MFVVSLGYSQEVMVLQDFENGGLGGAFGDLGSQMIVADPEAGGTRGMVAELITSAAGNVWQGTNIELNQNVLLDNADQLTMIVDVYSTTAISLAVKVVASIDGGMDSTTSVDHAGNGWQSLIATFNTGQDNTVAANGTYAGFVVYPNWDAMTNTYITPAIVRTLYIDNIAGFVGGETEPDAEPATAAPSQPARTPANVRSIFSSAYTDISVDTYDTDWCPGTTTEIMIAGTPTKKITGLGCEGIDFQSGRFDATGFGFFHMDIWTATDLQDKSFNFKFSDWQGGDGEAGALEYSATNGNILLPGNEGTWISIDLPLSSFTSINGVDGSDVVQFVISSDLGTVYYDNLYLHNNNLSTDDFADAQFKVYPNPTKNNWNIKSKTTISSVTVYDILGKQVSTLTPNTSAVEISTSNIKSGVYFARIEGINGSKTVKLIKE